MNVNCRVLTSLAVGGTALFVLGSFGGSLYGDVGKWGRVSPYHVCDYVNRADRPDLAALWASLAVPQGDFLCNDSSPCSAITYLLRNQRDSIQYAVIRLRINQFDPPFRYLLYSRSAHGDSWRFRGNVDFGFDDTDNCYAPKPAIRSGAGRNWLVFRYPRLCRGTGCAMTQEQWIDIGDSRLQKAQIVNVEGHDFAGYDFDPAWEWKEEVLGIERSGELETLRTRLTIFFFKGCKGGVPFAQRIARATFIRQNAEFSLQPDLSDPDYNDLLKLTNYPSVERDEVLLKYVMPSLQQMAAGSNRLDRQWLLEFLSRCANSSEKAALMNLLSASRK
jgi:hypothetical protein